MSRVVYVNGSYVSHRDAAVHVEDRGYQFGDGVYEVVLLINGRMADCEGHLKRLNRSLRKLEMQSPVSEGALRQIAVVHAFRQGQGRCEGSDVETHSR